MSVWKLLLRIVVLVVAWYLGFEAGGRVERTRLLAHVREILQQFNHEPPTIHVELPTFFERLRMRLRERRDDREPAPAPKPQPVPDPISTPAGDEPEARRIDPLSFPVV